jgi:hypothetical protein
MPFFKALKPEADLEENFLNVKMSSTDMFFCANIFPKKVVKKTTIINLKIIMKYLIKVQVNKYSVSKNSI